MFGHGNHRLLVHPHVVDAHAAEDGEGLDKVLVVAGELEAVELVDELEDAQDLARFPRAVRDRHAQHSGVPERRAPVHGLVEALVLKSQHDNQAYHERTTFIMNFAKASH